MRGQLVCHGRAVVSDEWVTMRTERESRLVNGWLEGMDRTLETLVVTGDKQAAAYAPWLDQARERQDGRRSRLAEAAPFVPPVMWLVLVLAGGLVMAYAVAYADPAELPGVQVLTTTAVTTMVVSGLVLVWFLDHPYHAAAAQCGPSP